LLHRFAGDSIFFCSAEEETASIFWMLAVSGVHLRPLRSRQESVTVLEHHGYFVVDAAGAIALGAGGGEVMVSGAGGAAIAASGAACIGVASGAGGGGGAVCANAGMAISAAAASRMVFMGNLLFVFPEVPNARPPSSFR
jgi:hypothetical protein